MWKAVESREYSLLLDNYLRTTVMSKKSIKKGKGKRQLSSDDDFVEE